MSDEGQMIVHAEIGTDPHLYRTRLPIPPFPPEIAKAICRVMLGISKIDKSETNNFDNYKYASVDDYFEATRKLCAEAGLIVFPVEVSQDYGVVQTKNGDVPVAVFVFEFMLVHESGVMWQHPYDQRKLRLQLRGPQTAGIAKSYVQKQYERSLFKLATGEPDADALGSLDEEVDEMGEPVRRKRKPRGEAQVVQPPPANGEKRPLPPRVGEGKPASAQEI